jgi:hypothetical protein
MADRLRASASPTPLRSIRPPTPPPLYICINGDSPPLPPSLPLCLSITYRHTDIYAYMCDTGTSAAQRLTDAADAADAALLRLTPQPPAP